MRDRLDLPGAADFSTPEQYQPAGPMMVDGRPVAWEAGQTLTAAGGQYWEKPGIRGCEGASR